MKLNGKEEKNMNIAEEKHDLAVLVELVLYNEVRSISEGKVLDKQKEREKLIDRFISENRERFADIPYEEYVRYINFVLERTENNIRQINKDDDDRDL